MTVAMQASETMGCRFGLCDLRRTALNIVLSPDHKLAAVSDALGRVLLLDAFRGIVLRIFKGYREAQCSFIQVPDERHSKHRIGNKVALFLVIYSSKKGTVEIFTVQQGSKVTTFSASRFSRLIYNDYGLMGFNTVSKSRYICPFGTVLIDSDGQIKEISIPFHFALNEKNNKKARDIHLFKKLKQFLKVGDCDSEALTEEICTFCSEMKTSEIKLQTLEFLIISKSVPAEATLKCVEFFLQEAEDNLKIMAEHVQILLNFFLFAENHNENDNRTVDMQEEHNLSIKQLNNLQRFIDLRAINNQKESELKVAFQENENVTASEFLQIFDLTKPEIVLKPKSDDFLLLKVSDLIYKKYICNKANLEKLEEEMIKTKLTARDMLFLLIHYWVNRNFEATLNLEEEMNNLLSLILIILKTANQEELISDYNSTSLFWSNIREILANSLHPFPALTAAMIFKIVCHRIEKNDTNTELEENMEVLSQESIEWTVLIGKLEDISLLNIILLKQPSAKHSPLPKLKHDKIEISLKYVLEKGRGSISELVAKWVTISGIKPENIVLNDILLRKKLDKDQEIDNHSDSDDDDLPERDIMPHQVVEIESEEILEHLNLLKKQFPYSLEASALLSNMCWEYALTWQKDIQDLPNLEACITCLTQIPNCHIREGLFNLVWNTHLKILFDSTCKLVNKVGRLPKERLCRQDTGLSDYQIVIFLGISTKFLDTYMDAVQESFERAKPELNFEQLWENGDVSRSLVELTLQQSVINYDLLHLHYQLSLSLQMITVFSIKHSKPVNNLFESYMLGLFFSDFQTQTQINWNYADSKVQTSRTQFLTKVITASLETVTMDDDNKVFAGEHVNWMEKIVDLGRLWNLDIDYLRRFEVVQIYASGFDSFGDEMFSFVEEKKKLGVELLEVAAKRLSQFLATSPHLGQNMSVLSTVVTRYTEQLVSCRR